MRKFCFLVVSTLVAIAAAAQNPVVRVDPALDDIVAADAKVETLATGMGHLEGPVWVRKAGYLAFTDNFHNVIDKWNPADGKVSVILEHADQAFTPPPTADSNLGGGNGMTADKQGRLVFGNRVDHDVVRIEKDGKRTVLVSQYEGKNFNGINDLVYKSDGALYFTDPIWGVGERKAKNLPEPNWQLPFRGVFLLKGKKLTLLTKEFDTPNGLAFTPDEKHLYVNDTFKKTIVKFDVKPDDTLDNGQLFIDMNGVKGQGGPDGMKVDKKGNVYCIGPGGIWIMSPEGKHIGTFVFPENPANFTFGDADGKSFYVAGSHTLYRMRLKVEGIRP